jgi:hypothetical protein
MDQVDLRPLGLQGVDGPVPAVGGLNGDFGVRARLRHGETQCHRIVVDAHDAELFAGLVLTDDQRSAQV